jgi:hypothetical protein
MIDEGAPPDGTRVVRCSGLFPLGLREVRKIAEVTILIQKHRIEVEKRFTQGVGECRLS